MKSKARRLAGEKDQKVDSSDWSPAEPLNADIKTGLRPLSRRAYKKGGKVVGDMPKARADRPCRATGGNIGTQMVNRNVKTANEEREGIKHVGALKKGGRVARKEGGSVPSAAETEDTKARLGSMQIKPVRGKAEHYKKGGTVKKAGGGGSWLEKMVGKPKTGSDLSQVGKDQTQRYSQEDKGALNRALRGDDALPSPDEAAESAARTGDKHGGRIKRKDGGKAGDKWIQKAISKPGALHKQLGVPKGEKIPAKKLHAAAEKGGKLGKRARLAETLKRINKYGGGALEAAGVKEGKKPSKKAGNTTIISVNLGKEAASMKPMADIMQPPMPPIPPPPLPGGVPGGIGAAPPAPAPAPVPPGAGAAGPMAARLAALAGRKEGGRITKVARSYKDMEAGAGSGEGRLQKTDIAKLHKDAPARKEGGRITKVAKSYKDMEAGAANGEGRLQKTDIAKAKKGRGK